MLITWSEFRPMFMSSSWEICKNVLLLFHWSLMWWDLLSYTSSHYKQGQGQLTASCLQRENGHAIWWPKVLKNKGLLDILDIFANFSGTVHEQWTKLGSCDQHDLRELQVSSVFMVLASFGRKFRFFWDFFPDFLSSCRTDFHQWSAVINAIP